MKLRALKHILSWTILGALFGSFFGAVSSLFQDGPSVLVGIQQSWWWFAIAAALKAASDLRVPAWREANQREIK